MPLDERSFGVRGLGGGRPSARDRATREEASRGEGIDPNALAQLGDEGMRRRSPQGPAALTQARADELRGLSCHPKHFAHGRNSWNRLTPREKWLVAQEMATRYGSDFATMFVEVARHGALVSGGATMVRAPEGRPTAPLLLTHGLGRTREHLWRQARCPHVTLPGCQTWIYPSGSELAICPPRRDDWQQPHGRLVASAVNVTIPGLPGVQLRVEVYEDGAVRTFNGREWVEYRPLEARSPGQPFRPRYYETYDEQGSSLQSYFLLEFDPAELVRRAR